MSESMSEYELPCLHIVSSSAALDLLSAKFSSLCLNPPLIVLRIIMWMLMHAFKIKIKSLYLIS